jgi:prepilin-type N-terminal cleavage/methylation domain-containing protein
MSIIPPPKKSGFTLIEIVIVLAIAALIMVIVFVAVSGAQRSRRDAVTKNAAYQALVAMATYAGINNGEYPSFSKGKAQLDSIMSGVKDGKGNQTYYCNSDTFNGNFANRDGFCFNQTEVDVYYAGNVICDTANPGAWKKPAGLITYPKNGAVTYYSENGSQSICIDNTQQ